VCAAIVLQEPARFLQHLFYFIAHESRPAKKSMLQQNKTKHLFYFIAVWFNNVQ